MATKRPERGKRARDPAQEDPPVLIDEDTTRDIRIVVYAVEAGATARRMGWAATAVARAVLRAAEAARVIDDDTPESAVRAAERWCLGGPQKELLLARRLADEAKRRAVNRLLGEGRIGEASAQMKVCTAIRALFMATPAFDAKRPLRAGAEWSQSADFWDALWVAARALSAVNGDPVGESAAAMHETFVGAMAEPILERRANPPRRPAAGGLPAFLRSGQSAWRWARKNVDIDLPDRRGNEDEYDARLMEYRDRCDAYADKAAEIVARGSVVVYRAIAVPAGLTWPKAVNVACLGKAWSLQRGGAGVYGQVPYGGRTRVILLAGRVASAAIDWEYGFASFMYYGESQWEISLLPHSPVELLEIDGEKLDGSVAGSSGAAGESWSDTCREVGP